ncbi:MAG: TonB-dependent receptor plug domain-containing protein, partial [Candidatus Koribacter versatilis]|nr:TonB-dependent receptor plug domain-containing protein [Candidatus Koribacter versatilis]
VHQRVEVTTTRLPEDPAEDPAPIEVFTGDELSARGARDFRTALSAAIGLEIAPGGDSGPASSVPDFWGLKEFDAFLLVVDGVPWGGAFNPALTTLDLNDIERIEVLRGPAPVTFGATSFVGVVHVVHKGVETPGRTLTIRGGSYGSGGGSFSTPIPLGDDWASRLSIDGDRLGFADDRTEYRRGHALWRVGKKPVQENRIWFNADVNWLDQNPASPRVREGKTLSPNNPVDANYNPQGAFLDDHRFTGMVGFDRKVGGALWSTTGSVSHSRPDLFRGFVTTLDDEVEENARGLKQKIHLTDVYVDSHLSWKLPRSVTFLAGADYLHGTGTAQGADFPYHVTIDGSPVQVAKPDVLDVTINDHRDFFGPYTSVEWRPLDRLRFDAGVRLNITHENRKDADPGQGTSTEFGQTSVRAAGSVGAIFTAWQQNQDSLNLYVNYRDTFKPAAIDFGIGENEGGGEGQSTILKPETSRSVEGGIKGRFWDRRVEWEASGFFMDFANLVVPTETGTRTNAGDEHFKGFETGASVFLPHDLMARATYTYHDARFVDFVFDFGDGNGLTQLAGKRLEMSANHLASASLFYTPIRGFLGGVSMNYTGGRFLNKRNSAPAEGFATVDLSAGYRTPRWELRVDARNLGDRRDPVAESELGDAQYYLMTSRRVEGSFSVHF